MTRSKNILLACLLVLWGGVTFGRGFAFLSFYGDIRNPQNYYYLVGTTLYRIDPNFLGGNSSKIQAVRNAFNTWKNSTLNFREVSSNEKAEVITANEPDQTWLAVTYVNFNNRAITDFTITFNSSYGWAVNPGPVWSGLYDIERVALHEVGHGLGLDHPNNGYSGNYTCSGSRGKSFTGEEVMYSHVESGTKDHDLTTDDACGRDFIYPPPVDATPPATITNLAITAVETDSVTLRWTAPGDNGASGRATRYDLRYSTSSITSQNFEQNSSVSGLFRPQVAGTIEKFTVNGLQSGRTYYFAIKTSDESNNTSGLSNRPSASTPIDSDLDGLSDAQEASLGTDPEFPDTDEDGMSDLYEIVAGTSALDAQSYTPYLFEDNFDDGALNGWRTPGGNTGVTWKVVNFALESKVTQRDGYSYLETPIDVSDLKSFAFSFDVTYTGGAQYGGYVLWGTHIDMNPKLYRIRDRILQQYSGISAGEKHHIFVKVKKATPFYKCDTYVDGLLKKANEPIQIGARSNSYLGLISPYYAGQGKVLFDLYHLWPGAQPLQKELRETFDSHDLGPWILTGSAVQWTFLDGVLRASQKVAGTSFADFRNGLWDLRGKDTIVEVDMGFYNGASTPAGITYRGHRISLTPAQLASNKMHHWILFLDQNGVDTFKTLYVDGIKIFENEWIDPDSLTDTTLGFHRQNGGGTVQWDNLKIRTQEAPENFPPILMPAGNKEVRAGSALQFQLKAVDEEEDPLTYSLTWVGTIPAGTSLDPSTGIFTWTPQNPDAGVYTATLTASEVGNPQNKDEETVQIVVSIGEEASVIFSEDFENGFDLQSWIPVDSNNVVWSAENGKLKATVVGTNYKYSKITPPNLDISALRHLAIEYDVTFTDDARWGGVWYRGVHGDLNPTRSGWRDGSFNPHAGLAANKKNHIVLFARQGSSNPATDVRTNSNPLFLNESIQTGALPNNTVGFVSPYYNGVMLIDNFKVHDLGQLAASPPTPLIFYEDFSKGNFDGWIVAKNTPGIRWSVSGGKLISKAVGDDAYSYLWPFALNVAGKKITIAFDVYYANSIPWGGLLYRGVHLDLFKRIGWRDAVPPAKYRAGLPPNTVHHIVLKIRPASPYPFSDLYVNGRRIFKDEPIQKSPFPNNSVGFVSVYDKGSYFIDNFLVQETP